MNAMTHVMRERGVMSFDESRADRPRRHRDRHRDRQRDRHRRRHRHRDCNRD